MGILKELISSGSKVSSKRIITLSSFVLLAIGFIANLFWDFSVEESIYSSIQYITIAGLGFVASEGFSTKKGEKSTKEEEIN